jgi:hypothetical protein
MVRTFHKSVFVVRAREVEEQGFADVVGEFEVAGFRAGVGGVGGVGGAYAGPRPGCRPAAVRRFAARSASCPR